jgi:hypothetical protein
MKTITARYIGEDGSMGLRRGETYEMLIQRLPLWSWRGSTIQIILPHPTRLFPMGVPYRSIETFLDNWTDIKTREGEEVR